MERMMSELKAMRCNKAAPKPAASGTHARRPRAILASVNLLSIVWPALWTACKRGKRFRPLQPAIGRRLAAHLYNCLVQGALQACRIPEVNLFGLLLPSSLVFKLEDVLLLPFLLLFGRHGDV